MTLVSMLIFITRSPLREVNCNQDAAEVMCAEPMVQGEILLFIEK
jgi:hypothetical protein